MTDEDLCYLSATEALTLFRSKMLSPVELLQAQLNRADKLEPTVNAFCSMRAEAAMVMAKEAERIYAETPELAKPLTGIPTALKNEHTLIGEHTDQGSLLLGSEPDTENAPITQRLLDAGTVIHGRTNVPEFFVAMFTRSKRYGISRNPWNPAYTTGGSSGGSAAALAAGLTTLASGSDIGGSIRIPAAYCGVVGLKPSYGRVPESNLFFAMNHHNHNGVLARTIADSVLAFNAVNGPHRADPTTVRPRIELSPHPAPVRGMRIALSMDLGFFEVSPEIQRSTRMAAEQLRDQGAIVDEIDLPWTSDVRTAFTHALVFILGRSLSTTIKGCEDRVNDYVKSMAQMSENITLDDHLGSFEVMTQMNDSLQDVFEQYDALICPTLAHNQWPAEGSNTPHDDLMQKGMTFPFNMLSRHPVLSVPSGRSAHGVPIGLQIVGPTYDEDAVIRVGAALEQAIRWTTWRPDINALTAPSPALQPETL
ncbi:Asp-tRNA(Asn)/Glu-tRNA(Gln) amidotransferase A subunit family amidase [Hydrogenophaga palleronii]|uniref:Asp-tRNA(Asn)/Glu-tRNA(Gln) amidotransferase A subunit family amidase n=1 Tax=Hydrogenophaga palleronii TaxID=65655 RepID=A0ABU1WRM3_9BURK|nr:amidase [Hydrogenophaga palleronii]MDR7151918.1 Asp-tRNA(Asn)/Glu-tRNA(Gln) amidotransferase A subunit family amidase [Hydrogenophaga palleronii]